MRHQTAQPQECDISLGRGLGSTEQAQKSCHIPTCEHTSAPASALAKRRGAEEKRRAAGVDYAPRVLNQKAMTNFYYSTCVDSHDERLVHQLRRTGRQGEGTVLGRSQSGVRTTCRQCGAHPCPGSAPSSRGPADGARARARLRSAGRREDRGGHPGAHNVEPALLDAPVPDLPLAARGQRQVKLHVRLGLRWPWEAGHVVVTELLETTLKIWYDCSPAQIFVVGHFCPYKAQK